MMRHTGPFGKAEGDRACLEVGPVPTAAGDPSLWGSQCTRVGYGQRPSHPPRPLTRTDAFRRTLLAKPRDRIRPAVLTLVAEEC